MSLRKLQSLVSRPILLKIAYLFFTYIYLVFIKAGLVLAAPPSDFDAKGPFQSEMVDGAWIIEKMIKEADSLKDYSLVFETKTFKGKETISERGKLSFKKPKLMRLEEIGDYKKGSLAVLGKDGMVRAHAGGLIKFVTLTMRPDDKQLDAANGDKMEDSDLASLANLLGRRLKEGNLSRVTAKPVTCNLGSGAGSGSGSGSGSAYVLELFHKSNPTVCLKRVYVDPRTYLPLRWDDYDYKTPCTSKWFDVRTNIGLSDDLFKI